LALGLVLPATLAAAPRPALAATQPITFTLFVGSPCFDGWATPGSTVSYKWKDAAGDIKGQGAVQASDEGGLWISECSDNFSGPLVEPGDRLVASDGHSTRRFNIPDLSIQLNRVSDVIKGTAPAGTGVRLEYLFPAYPGFEIVTDAKKLPVHANGQWSFDITRYNDVGGGDGAGVVWKSELGDKVFMFADAPFVTVTIGKAGFSGEANRYTTMQTALKDGTTGEVIGSASSELGVVQAFSGAFRDANGDPVQVSAGDRIVSNIAADSGFVVPDIQFTADAATDTVNGRCFDAGRLTPRVHVAVYRTGIQRGYVYLTANPDGTFEEQFGRNHGFPNPAVLKSGDRVLVRCFLSSGDIVQKWGDVL
jgi:hypothetical protein